MQIQLVAMLFLALSAQARGDQRPQLEPPPRVKQVATVHVRTRGESHDLTLEMPEQATTPGEDEDQPPARPVAPFDLRTAALAQDNFDRWLFAREPSEPARQEHLKKILDATIDLAASEYKLTDRERAKLRLAGRGDIKRFFDEVQKRRDAFEIERREFHAGLAALRRLDALLPSYRDGPFGTGSLFAKTLHKINNDRKVWPIAQ